MADVGRPTDYREEFNEQAYKFALLGATDEQISDFFGICVATLNLWKHKHHKFIESIKKGKLNADAQVAEALYHRAKGYKHPDVHVSNFQGEITLTPLTKYYPPDTAAAFIWLKNRQGKTWKDRKDSSENIDNADEHFKKIADAITASDTDPEKVLS